MKTLVRTEKIKRQMRFGDYLHGLRKDQNVSLRKVSEAVKISGTYLFQVESGRKALTDPIMFRKLAAYYQVPVEELLKIAGYLPEDDSEERRVENLFKTAIRDPRFKYGSRMRHKDDYDVKRFVVEMYEKLNKKR